jgi:hypothetical protein
MSDTDLKSKVKVKFTLEQATKAQRGTRAGGIFDGQAPGYFN